MAGALSRILRSGAACALLGIHGSAEVAAEPLSAGRATGFLSVVQAPLDVTGDRLLAPVWSFRAGAPLRAGPGLGADSVAVGTADGYVHLLRGDGSYRWSFTVKGAVIAPPIIGEQGTVYVATSTRRLYALTPSGTLGWTTTLAGTPLSPLEKALDGSILIATREGLLYAVTPGGRMRTALTTREPLSAPPIALDETWAAGGSRGTLFRVEGFSLRREKLASTPLTALTRAGRQLVALSDGKLTGALTSSQGSYAWLGCPGPTPVVVDESGKIARIAAGKLEPLSALVEPASAPPSCLADGRVLVPHESGALSVVGPGSKVTRHVVARGRLFSPLVDAARLLVIATSADGQSVALPTGGL
jgi:outer membrane protein assembly factor BamB